MLVRTPKDIGALIRERRRDLGLTQEQLAASVGTRRQWVIALEAGRSATDTRLLLRALDVLDLRLDIAEAEKVTATEATSTQDLDALRRVIRERSS